MGLLQGVETISESATAGVQTSAVIELLLSATRRLEAR